MSLYVLLSYCTDRISSPLLESLRLPFIIRNLKEGVAGSGMMGECRRVSTFQQAMSPSCAETVTTLGI
jgi:hypothetical protein